MFPNRDVYHKAAIFCRRTSLRFPAGSRAGRCSRSRASHSGKVKNGSTLDLCARTSVCLPVSPPRFSRFSLSSFPFLSIHPSKCSIRLFYSLYIRLNTASTRGGGGAISRFIRVIRLRLRQGGNTLPAESPLFPPSSPFFFFNIS